MLASACPGWICYAEKTHGELLPFISKTKSPQQVAGTLLKRWYSSRIPIAASEDYTAPNGDMTASHPASSVYHVTIMPCYDKKLEASRPDFYDELLGTKDVDCVITTGELDRLMIEEGFDIRQPVPDEAEGSNGSQRPAILPSLLDHPGSASGSYLFQLMSACWAQRLQEHPSDQPPTLDLKVIRTSDYTEYTLRAPAVDPSTPSGPILFRGAHCYGFRNLQNLVRKVQRQTGVRGKKSGSAASRINGQAVGGARRGGLRGRGVARGGMVKRAAVGASNANGDASLAIQAGEEEEARGYDYVEVMACPSGCVNGGGQIRPPTAGDASTMIDSKSVSMALGSGIVESTEAQVDKMQIDTPPPSKATLDPEGYTSGWSTPGMQDEAEQAMVNKGWQGTSKEWVKRVEGAYWQGSTQGGGGLKETLLSHLTVATRQRDDVAALTKEILQTLQQQQQSDAVTEVKPTSLLRTDYRSIADEEGAVNGLAVQW